MRHDIAFFEDEHRYLVDGVNCPSVTEIISQLTSRGYANINPSVLEAARLRGTAVHEALEDLDYDIDPEIVPEIMPYIQAYEEWKSVYRPSWYGIEQTVFCEEGWFIGTLDRIGCLNGSEFAIVDIKTSQPTRESYLSVSLQTTAYAMAYASEHGFNPDWKDISRYGLFLMKDGKFRLLNCKEFEGTNHYDPADAFGVLLNTHKMITRLLERRGK